MTLSTEPRRYDIVATKDGRSEVVDHAESESDAAYLMAEYQIAYGSEFEVTFRPG